MPKDLKVAVIGVGGIAATHMPGWAASPHTEVVAGADVSTASLEAWGAKWKVRAGRTARCWPMNTPSINTTMVCTPANSIAPLPMPPLKRENQ